MQCESLPTVMCKPYRGIKSSKKEAILKLLTDIPSTKKKFWLELPTNEASRDLVANLELDLWMPHLI